MMNACPTITASMPDSLIPTVTTEAFPDVVIAASCPVVVEFSAHSSNFPGFSACQLEVLAAEYQGRLLVAKVNVESEPALAAAFGIRNLPAILLYDQGSPRGLIVGKKTAAQLREWVEGHLP